MRIMKLYHNELAGSDRAAVQVRSPAPSHFKKGLTYSISVGFDHQRELTDRDRNGRKLYSILVLRRVKQHRLRHPHSHAKQAVSNVGS